MVDFLVEGVPGPRNLGTRTNYYASHENVVIHPPTDVGRLNGQGRFVGSVTLEDLDALEELAEELAVVEGPRIRPRVIITSIPNRSYYSNHAVVRTEADNLNNNVPNPDDDEDPPEGNNNNADRSDSGGENRFMAVLKSLPPISTFMSVVMIVMYFCSGYFLEEEINVCWSKVVDGWQVWRILVAHFFHFGRFHIVMDVVTLMAMGHYLEQKINKTAMLVLILCMGVLSNVLYLIISKIVGEESNEMTIYGFAHVHYGLRIVLAMIQEGLVHPTLILGIFPVAMSTSWGPFQPLLEVFLLKLIVEEMPVSGPIAGIISGFIVSHYLRRFKPSSFGKDA